MKKKKNNRIPPFRLEEYYFFNYRDNSDSECRRHRIINSSRAATIPTDVCLLLLFDSHHTARALNVPYVSI